jgi:hypothetical protein
MLGWVPHQLPCVIISIKFQINIIAIMSKLKQQLRQSKLITSIPCRAAALDA